MKKIMFNDRYGLTQAVLSGRKTQTRRIIKFSPIDAEYVNDKGWSIGGYVALEIINHYSRYNVGEVVAIAQSYKDAGYIPNHVFYRSIPAVGGYRRELASEQKGWTNKMFVRADLMPHHIRITNVRVERLQGISDEDCIKEGIRDYSTPNEKRVGFSDFKRETIVAFKTPREAYAALIDRISGKGTWASNPYVFAYEFERVD